MALKFVLTFLPINAMAHKPAAGKEETEWSQSRWTFVPLHAGAIRHFDRI